MKLIVGLGNPGAQYEKTRHNAGFLALDRVAKRHSRAVGGVGARQRFGGEVLETSIGSERCLLLRPMRFMNCSGSSVAEALNFYKMSGADDLLVIVDDYALPLGTIRIRQEGSAGGHNGLTDVERALGTTVYPRLRIGVDPPPPAFEDPADWVLSRFTDENLKALDPVLEKTADAVDVFVTQGVSTAMNTFNTRPRPPAAPKPATAADPAKASGANPFPPAAPTRPMTLDS